MSNGGTPDSEQPGHRPLAYDPPPWEAYFGTAPVGVAPGAAAGAASAGAAPLGGLAGTGDTELAETAPQQAVSVEPPPMPWRDEGVAAQPPSHPQTGYPPQAYRQPPYQQPMTQLPPGYQQPTHQQALFQQAPHQQAPHQQAPYQQAPYQQAPYQQAPYQPSAYPPHSYQESPYQQQQPYPYSEPLPRRPGPGWAGQGPGVPTGPAGPAGERPAWVIPALIAVVAATVGIALGVMFGLGSGDDPEDPSAAVAGPTPSAQQAEPTPSPGTTTSEPPQEVTDSREIPADEAAGLLAEHGLKLAGEGRAGWVWTDANGENVLYVTRQVLQDSGDAEAATVRVMHAAHLDGDAEVLRTMQDPGRGPCEQELMTDYTPSSITVTDANADGVAEVTVGWYYACRSDIGPFDAKLALISDGDKYIFRGTGIPLEYAPETEQDLAYQPKVSFTPTPGKSGWIDGTFAATKDVFHRIYVGGRAD